MKKARIVIAALVCVILVCGVFYFVKNRANSSPEEGDLSQIQKLITRNLEQQYPATPRVVILLYNKIIMMYYEGEYSEEEFQALAAQTIMLFDDELAKINPLQSYMSSLRAEIKEYKSRNRSIKKANVCDSRDVLFLTDPNNQDEIAYVTASYFVKEDTSYEKIYQRYVLRKDSEGCWKILTYYQIEGKTSEGEESDD